MTEKHRVRVDGFRPAVPYAIETTWTWRCTCGGYGQHVAMTSQPADADVKQHLEEEGEPRREPLEEQGAGLGPR